MAELILKLLFYFTMASAPRHMEHEVVIPADEGLLQQVEVAADELLEVSVDAEGQISVGGQNLDLKGLEDLLKEKLEEGDKITVGLKMDDKLKMERVLELMELCEKLDIKQVMVLGRAEE